MKKSIVLILIMIIALSASVFGADRVDMIVLLDNSVSVLPVYDRIQESLLGKIISEHLSPGDTFSLVTFADSPEVEISREIKSQGDIDEILAYSQILQPMGSYTDLVLALRFLYKYTLDLPLSNHKKIVILTDGIHDPPPGSPYIYGSADKVRDEIRKAAEEIHREGWDISIVELEDGNSASADLINKAEAENKNESGVQSTLSTEDDSVKSPSDNVPSDGNDKIDLIDTVAEGLGSKPNIFNSEEDDMAGIALGIPLVSIPEHLGDTTGELIVPLNIVNRSNDSLLFSLSSVISDGNDILKEKTSILLKPKTSGELEIELSLPADGEVGENVRDITFKLMGGLKSDPQSFRIRYNYEKKGNLNRGMDFLLDWRVIAIVIGVIIALIIIVLIKRTSAATDHRVTVSALKDDKNEKVLQVPKNKDDDKAKTATGVVEEDSSERVSQKADYRETLRIKPKEEIFLSTANPDIAEALIHNKNRPIRMLVSGQNTKLGILNTEWLGENKKRTVGGATSAAFRIFFVRVPSVIARIECTGKDFVFYPEKNEYFPELEGPLSECLNKKIMVINKDQKVFYIEFIQWVSELERINRLLSMTNYTGKPDIDY